MAREEWGPLERKRAKLFRDTLKGLRKDIGEMQPVHKPKHDCSCWSCKKIRKEQGQ